MRGSVRCVLGALMIGLAACTDSTSPVETGTVTGTVTDASTGLPMASVAITAASRTAHTASDGSYSIGQVPVGRQRITATLTGYVALTDSVTISAASPVVFDVALHAEVMPAPTGVTAVAGSTNGSVVVTWNPVAGATSYTVVWGYTEAQLLQSGTRVLNATSPFLQEGLGGGKSIYYVVTATGAPGESAPSAAVAFVPTSSIEITLVVEGFTVPIPIGPLPNGLVDSVVRIAVLVRSQYSLQSVVAHIGTAAGSMTLVPSSNRWETSLTLLALPSPSLQQFWVTATDVRGDTASLSYPVRYDRPPVVTLTLPTDGTVATPLMALRASCVDDGPSGCTALTAGASNGASGILLATGQSTIDQTVSLSSLDGSSVRLQVRGTDAADQSTEVIRTVPVESSAHLVPVATSGHGIVVDASSDRLLALDSTTTLDSVRIVDMTSGTSTVVLTLSTGTRGAIYTAKLTPVGAIVMASVAPGFLDRLYEWRNGTANQPAGNEAVSDLQVSGNFALWSQEAVLTRRTLSSGSNVVVTNTAGNSSNSVAANGDVAFWDSDYNIWYNHAGSSTQLTSDGSPSVLNLFPVTDGNHVVFRHSSGAVPYQTVLHDPAGNVVLSASAEQLRPGYDYRLNNGWVAFTRPDIGGVRQAWVRSPTGVESQLSFFGNLAIPYGAQIQALSEAGEVVFLANGRRYRAAAGGSAVDISSMLGVPLYIDDQLYIALGASLYRVH